MRITPITRNNDLARFCEKLSDVNFITVDTEFIRDNTYWPKLCLVQIAGPNEAQVIDPLAKDLDLTPVFNLLKSSKLLKVFHAAKQDLEIFFHLTGLIPTPIFDTQIAAMVCGFGDQASYETLVNRLFSRKIDKVARFTDWAQRPLTNAQLDYALADVTYLRQVYTSLMEQIEKSGRASWLEEEIAKLIDTESYSMEPENAWRKVKHRSNNSRVLGILRELAAWREHQAQARNVPRNRIVRDDVLVGIAGRMPRAVDDLINMRGLPKRCTENHLSKEILEAVSRGISLPSDKLPNISSHKPVPTSVRPLIDALKILLRSTCEAHNVAPKLVASSRDLEKIAATESRDLPALRGWRWEVFGKKALAFKQGRLSMSVKGGSIALSETTANKLNSK